MMPATIATTFFVNQAALKKNEVLLTPEELCRRIAEMVTGDSDRLPWLKLAIFGNERSKKNSLRHNKNVLALSGCEGDYDDGKVSVEEAIAIARKANLLCIIHTTPSSTPTAPHWHVLVFFSQQLSPAEHSRQVKRLNGIFNGILAPESFTLSQAYRYGRVAGDENFRIELIKGTPLDLLEGVPEIGKVNGAANGSIKPNRDGSITLNAGDNFFCSARFPDVVFEHEEAAKIVSGASYHPPSLRLIGKWADQGVSARDTALRLKDYYQQVSEDQRDDRWHARYDELSRCVQDIYEKEFAKAADTADTAAGEQQQSPPPGEDPGATSEPPPRLITATPFVWVDPATLPRRQFLYGRHLIRRYISCTVAPGGFGKSSLVIGEALAMVTGRALLDEQPKGQLRVWHINLEDPEDDPRQRFAAAGLRYGIDGSHIGNRLFLDSGRNTKLVIAKETRNGIEIAVPLIEAIKQEIMEKQIDVLQIDPFIKCHSVSENDNNKIATVAYEWAMIAEATNCAIELVHHARKGNGQAFKVEDSRGASALIDAVRSARVINGMTPAEAEQAKVENHRTYFSVTNGKSNLTPPSDKVTWRHITGVALGNGDTPFDREGDSIGVVEVWKWPDEFAEISVEEAKEIQRRIAAGGWRESSQTTTWAGIVVADVLGLDVTQKPVRERILRHLKSWLASGALRVATKLDKHRKPRTFIEVGQWIT